MNFSTSLQTEKLSIGDFFFLKLLMPTAPMIVAVGECLWIYSFIVRIFFFNLTLGGNFELEPPPLSLLKLHVELKR